MTAFAKVADIREIIARPKHLSALFHWVNRIIPDGHKPLTVPPDMPARDALKLMSRNGFSQLPVKHGDTVLGVFSYRDFALAVAMIGDAKVDAASLPVEEFINREKPAFADLNDEFKSLIKVLNEKDAVIVSGPKKLIAILTPMDVLNYLYSVANAFVLLQEIELSLRTLIRAATEQDNLIESCIKNALSYKYQKGLPICVESMTFDDYIALLMNRKNWKCFEIVFGGMQDLAKSYLVPAHQLRNQVFHFRREITVEDHEQLAETRNWLLRRIQKLQGGEGGTEC